MQIYICSTVCQLIYLNKSYNTDERVWTDKILTFSKLCWELLGFCICLWLCHCKMLLILLSCIPSLFFLQKFSLQRFYPFTKFIHIFGFSFCTNKSIFNSKGLLIEHQNLKNRYPYNQFGNHQIRTVIHLWFCKLHDKII